METSSGRILLLLFLSLACACGQTISDSTVEIHEEFLTDQTRRDLTEAVYTKANQMNGTCKVLNDARQYHTCSFASTENPALRLTIGYDLKGRYRITVTSTFGHWLPQREKKITSGRFVGDAQRELEAWMRSLVPDEAIVRAERSYVDYETIQEF